jgi:hypothetical protein
MKPVGTVLRMVRGGAEEDGNSGRRGVPCLGAWAWHAAGCNSGPGMGTAGAGGVRALPCRGKQVGGGGGPVEEEKGEGGRGCQVGAAVERGNQLTGRSGREKQTYRIRNRNSKLIQT